MIYEALNETSDMTGAGGCKFTSEELTDMIENEIFDLCLDPKSKVYREKTRTIVNRLKGSRFGETRKALKMGDMEIKGFVMEEKGHDGNARNVTPTPA